jgi:hypothetical protein
MVNNNRMMVHVANLFKRSGLFRGAEVAIRNSGRHVIVQRPKSMNMVSMLLKHGMPGKPVRILAERE